MSDGMLMKAIKAKAKRKYDLGQAEAASGGTKAGRANGKGLDPTKATAKSPAGVQKSKQQSQASKEAARQRQQERVKAGKAKQNKK